MVYTKTGDGGTTSLVGGSRVRKDDARVEAYGTVDELNSHLGLLAEMVRHDDAEHYTQLKAAQRNLFTLQTLLATEDAALYARLPQLEAAEVETLERQIDAITAAIPQLKNFVIAGGTAAGAQAHVCRTVCRRAERRVVTLARETIQPSSNQEIKQSTEIILRYLNRLSDYLFVLSRHSVVLDGKKEDLYIN